MLKKEDIMCKLNLSSAQVREEGQEFFVSINYLVKLRAKEEPSFDKPLHNQKHLFSYPYEFSFSKQAFKNVEDFFEEFKTQDRKIRLFLESLFTGKMEGKIITDAQAEKTFLRLVA